jgi:hypothetical protein
MSRKLFGSAITAATLWAVTSALGQGLSLPDGPGKETVSAFCGGCHDISRLRAIPPRVGAWSCV